MTFFLRVSESVSTFEIFLRQASANIWHWSSNFSAIVFPLQVKEYGFKKTQHCKILLELVELQITLIILLIELFLLIEGLFWVNIAYYFAVSFGLRIVEAHFIRPRKCWSHSKVFLTPSASVSCFTRDRFSIALSSRGLGGKLMPLIQ